MIKAADLRVGNIVKLPNNDWEIVGCVGDPDNGGDSVNGYDISLCEGVLLTEEWLERFGFYKEKVFRMSGGPFYSMNWIDYKYSFAFAEFRNDWGFYHSYTDAVDPEDDNRFDFISCGIRYVHELQNLFFALTGEELVLEN